MTIIQALYLLAVIETVMAQIQTLKGKTPKELKYDPLPYSTFFDLLEAVEIKPDPTDKHSRLVCRAYANFRQDLEGFRADCQRLQHNASHQLASRIDRFVDDVKAPTEDAYAYLDYQRQPEIQAIAVSDFIESHSADGVIDGLLAKQPDLDGKPAIARFNIDSYFCRDLSLAAYLEVSR